MHGSNVNPHWHNVLYSKNFGELCYDLKKYFNDLFLDLLNELKEASSVDEPADNPKFELSDYDRNTIQQKILER